MIDWSSSPPAVVEALSVMASKVSLSIAHSVPNLAAGPQAFEAISTLLLNLGQRVPRLISPNQVRAAVSLPTATKRSLDATFRRLEEAGNRLDGLEAKAVLIERAHSAAESLDATTDELEGAVASIRQSADEAAKLSARARNTADEAQRLVSEIALQKKSADEAMNRIDETFRAQTSQGLASAFSSRATQLQASVLVWLVVLLGSLSVAALIGRERFPEIQGGLGAQPEWGVVVVNVLLAAFALSGPVWMAWVATKQIGQRFRLAEDYSYKAALSTAYEGYRSEAVKLDPVFQAQLFGTALSRLDELPLRLVERDVHGSPMQEVLQRSGVSLPEIPSPPTLLDRVLGMVGLQRKAKPELRNVSSVEKADRDASEGA